MRLLFLFLSVFPDAAYAASPLVMNWSSRAYGPDGPWQAITIEVGSNGQSVDLYPGNNNNINSFILADSICSDTAFSTCYAADAGTYSQNESTTAVVFNPWDSSYPFPWVSFYWNAPDEEGSLGGGYIGAPVADQINVGSVVPNVSFTAIHAAYQIYPNGRKYPISVGNLALGTQSLNDPSYASISNFSMIAAWLYTSGGENSIPSYSYGLHIGSVNPAIAGSLVLGGYDKSRILGEVSSQPITSKLNHFGSGVTGWQIELKDIGLGVAAGGSPFSFTSKNGLFLLGSDVPQPVLIDPTVPYMYLPEATCDAITSSLPVSFNSSLGLYIWDTTSSQYTNIASSAAYLSFTFNKDASLNDQNITVKVPLTLLTLTLQDPLADQNTTYFPCFPNYFPHPTLGRAFLQAAFIGVNWFEGDYDTGIWFLSQAPGPGLPNADITAINPNDNTLAASNYSWEQSWAGYWHPRADYGSGSSNGGLTTGAKVGIGVGMVILITAGVWTIALRRRRRDAPVEGKEADF